MTGEPYEIESTVTYFEPFSEDEIITSGSSYESPPSNFVFSQDGEFGDLSNFPNGKDLLFRVREDMFSGDYSITVDSTTNIIRPFLDLAFRYNVLSLALKNLWESHKYSQEYAQFLLGAYSSEEFRVISEKFACEFREIEPGILSKAALAIMETLEENLSSGDLSELLTASPGDIEAAISSVQYISKEPQEEIE